MDRTILHADLNNFYASVACLCHPELKNVPMAVCGDVEARHGVVLAKNYPAKYLGVKTGEAIWQAKQKAKDLIVVPPDFTRYAYFSQMTRLIYGDYTDQIEPFSIDEAYLDVSGSLRLFGDGESIAYKIRQRIKEELGLTVSVGVSFNKIFAKLGSDMKKPDATTVISRDNYKEKVWPLDVSNLLYVGNATRKKLESRSIFTIGDLANTDVKQLKSLLGIWGENLWIFANGYDISPVRKVDQENIIKSIGNSTTTVRDLYNIDDVKLIIYILAESVGARLRAQGLKCTTIVISVRDNDLVSFERQAKLAEPTNHDNTIAKRAIELFQRNYKWQRPIRTIGVRVSELLSEKDNIQLNLFNDDKKKYANLDRTIDAIRCKFGRDALSRACVLMDKKLSGIKPQNDSRK